VHQLTIRLSLAGSDQKEIDQIKTALNEGVPFVITTPGGDKFRVSDKSQLWIARKRARRC
jgi:hypothetical protein